MPFSSTSCACLFLIAAVAGAPPAHAAGPGEALYAALVKDAIPPSLRNKAQVQVLDVPREERARGVIGSILVSVPSEKSYVRYFVFDTQANAVRGYKRYAAEPWARPMRRIAQEEMTPGRGMAPGKITCELQRNEATRLYAGACLHMHATLPVLVRGTQPVKFDDRLKFNDAKLQQARQILAAAESMTLAGEGSLQAEKAGAR